MIGHLVGAAVAAGAWVALVAIVRRVQREQYLDELAAARAARVPTVCCVWDEDDDEAAFLAAARAGLFDVPLEELSNLARVCRVCGCTEMDACIVGCSWVPDPYGIGPLCSECEPDERSRYDVDLAGLEGRP